MDSQKIEQSLKQILDKCGENIVHNHSAFKSAVFDLLDQIHYSGERLVLKHAMESDAFWILLETPKITADNAKKAAVQMQQESRMTKEDAELVVRCITAVRGVNTDTDFDTAHKECMGETAADPVKSDDTIKPTVANKKKIVIAAVCAVLFAVIAAAFLGGGKTKENVADSGREIKENTAVSAGILMEDDGSNTSTVLGSNISRESIVSVAFLDTVKDAPDTAWDASLNRDGTVMAWTKQNADNEQYYDLFIGAEGGVKAQDCQSLFEGYSNVETIAFHGCFDTSEVKNMSFMFLNCEQLESLDVSSFDTSQVTDMKAMFARCVSLTQLDVSGFDTSQVTNMLNMFGTCANLTQLDVSGFDTSQVTNMGGMFAECVSLTQLDLSSFDTSQVTNMEYMFVGCSITAEEAGLKIN